MEPSFLLRPLDRYETSLLLLRAVIPRNVLNLWIAMGLRARASAQREPVGSCQGNFLGICKKARNLYQNHYYLWLGQYGADA
jgi:hypothetical protein